MHKGVSSIQKDKYGNTTTYEYDGESRLSKVKNASGKELVVQYDGNNKKQQE